MHPGNQYYLPFASFLLLSGMLFLLMTAHFLGIEWHKTFTITFYFGLLLWIAFLAYSQRKIFSVFTPLDILFTVFILLVTVRVIVEMESMGYLFHSSVRYLPFLTLLPYISGRMMQVRDVLVLMRLFTVAVLLLLPLLLLDRMNFAGGETGRWPVFGLNYGPLLVGSILVSGLLSTYVILLYKKMPEARKSLLAHRALTFLLVGLITTSLVWVTARGWLVAGVFGFTVISVFAWSHTVFSFRLGGLLFFYGVIFLSLMFLPKFDSNFGILYSSSFINTEAFSGILGEACAGKVQLDNSLSIRMALYREAVDMFLNNPLYGVGVDKFSAHSCVSITSFPHSTILQAFSELGLPGGLVLLGILVFAGLYLVNFCFSVTNRKKLEAVIYLHGFFVAFTVSDQIYGNYLVSAGTWLVIGIIARMQQDRIKEANNV